MKLDSKNGNGWGTPFANQHQVSQDRPSARIYRVREREGNQGTPGIVTARMTSGRPATHEAN